MKQCKGTGVQQAINRAVFELLDMIVVYPVEDENHFCNKQGDVLPDAFLMRRGSTPHDLAFQVHTDIGKGFLYAIDARTKMRIKETHELQEWRHHQDRFCRQVRAGAAGLRRSMTIVIQLSDNAAALS